jgi:CheY-like chemotaxis protein
MEDLLRRTLGEQVVLLLDLPADLPMALADANQLESAVLNLAINARDAMPGGGRLTIAARSVRLTSADLADSDNALPGEYVEVSVADTGVGMAPEVRAKVFDPFFTTKPLGQGTGLGLSMIYGFVQQSHGHVRLESQENAGTTVRLYLPMHEGSALDATVEDTGGAPVGAGETVLVVEDDPSVRLLVMQVLAELGYDAIETADGRAAVPVLESDRTIDLVVTDVGLPGLNGRQIAEIARQHRPDLPILFITGYAEQAADQAQFLEAGMEILAKPFDIAQLSQRIRNILEARRV